MYYINTQGMPHVCGDEPPENRVDVNKPFVCPTYVGMNRSRDSLQGKLSGMPHVCGDEPSGAAASVRCLPYAPRMWG